MKIAMLTILQSLGAVYTVPVKENTEEQLEALKEWYNNDQSVFFNYEYISDDMVLVHVESSMGCSNIPLEDYEGFDKLVADGFEFHVIDSIETLGALSE